MVNQMAQGCGNNLAVNYELHKHNTGFKNCHLRELAVNRISDPRFTDIVPKAYFTKEDKDKEIFVFAMEYIENVSHMDSVNNVGIWKESHIKTVLSDIAKFHSIYLGKEEELKSFKWISYFNTEKMINMGKLWRELLVHNEYEFPDIYTKPRVALINRFINDIPNFWPEIESSPRTLVHNDFNPRNICLKELSKGDFKLCAYDWELATIHVPQHDVAEFLSFILPPDTDIEVWDKYLDYYRECLEEASGETFESERFKEIFHYACYDMAVNRLALYTMAHTFKDYTFLPRVLNTIFNYLEKLLPWSLIA